MCVYGSEGVSCYEEDGWKGGKRGKVYAGQRVEATVSASVSVLVSVLVSGISRTGACTEASQKAM